MAKSGKFSALAEFRQQPELEIETEVPQVPDSLETPLNPENEMVETLSLTEPKLSDQSNDLDDHAFDEIESVKPSPSSRLRSPVPVRPRGRPPGKRSDPDWKLYSHFLKRSTQRQAAAILFEADDGRDLSDVLQSLLEKWVVRQCAKT